MWILSNLAPALVKINRVYLDVNPDITNVGWKYLADEMMNESQLELISLKGGANPKNQYPMKNDDDIKELTKIIVNITEVDISKIQIYGLTLK